METERQIIVIGDNTFTCASCRKKITKLESYLGSKVSSF